MESYVSIPAFGKLYSDFCKEISKGISVAIEEEIKRQLRESSSAREPPLGSESNPRDPFGNLEEIEETPKGSLQNS